MAGKDLKSIESFKDKIVAAAKGDNKVEGIRDAIKELLQAQGVTIPDLETKLDFSPKKEQLPMTGKKSLAAVDSFLTRINEAIKGDNKAEDIMKAVTELQKAYGISNSHKKAEPLQSYHTNLPVQTGYTKG